MEDNTTKNQSSLLDSKQVFGRLDEKYSLIRRIGDGGTAKVYLACELGKKFALAIKILKSKHENSKNWERETTNQKTLDHENIMKMYTSGTGTLQKSSGSIKKVNYMVLEYLPYGELFDFIYLTKTGFGEYYGRHILRQVISALETCHNQKIIHRDVKNENLIVGNDWKVKLGDFGFSIVSDSSEDSLLKTALGTENYAAPEVLHRKNYLGPPADIFSLGVSLFVLVTGKMPFKKASKSCPYYSFIVLKKYEDYWSKVEPMVNFPMTDEFKFLFISMIAYDPTERPSLAEIKCMEWFKGSYPDESEVHKEFSSRMKEIKRVKQMELKKSQQANKGQHKVYKSEVDEEETFENLKIKNQTNLQNLYKIQISKEGIDTAYSKVIKFFSSNDAVASIDRNEEFFKLKVKYNEIENEENDVEIENLEIKIEVTQDEGNFYLEFMKEKGAKNLFFDEYSKFTDNF